MEEDKKEKSFVVKDRRMFSETGESRDEDREVKDAGPVEPPPEAPRQETQAADASTAEEADYPEINFANFIISLSTSAMFHFGDFPDPATNKAQINLFAAKQTIDIIGMLEEKTKNNLTKEEENLITTVLFELRMRYVKAKAGSGG